MEAQRYLAIANGANKKVYDKLVADQEAHLAQLTQNAQQSYASIAAAYEGMGQELIAITGSTVYAKPLQALPA
jgi:predicted ATPase